PKSARNWFAPQSHGAVLAPQSFASAGGVEKIKDRTRGTPYGCRRCQLIPERERDWRQATVSSPNDQIYHGPSDIRAPGSIRYCLAGIGPSSESERNGGTSQRGPTRDPFSSPKLFKPSLAQL